MALSSKRQREVHCYRRFSHSSFCRRHGYHLAHIAYAAFLGQTALAAGEFGGCAGAREALRWGVRVYSFEGLKGEGKGGVYQGILMA